MAAKGKELYKRGAIWWYRFTNPRTSAQERGSTKASDKALAQQFLDRKKADAWVHAHDVQILEQFEEPKLWIEATTKWMQVKKKKKSIQTDVQRIDMLAPILNEIAIADIDDDLIRKLVVNDLCVRRKHAPATVNRYLDLIRSILKASERWRWISRAPMLEKPGASGERQRKAWLTPKQFFKAYDAMSPLKARVMMVALCTGMRADNIVKLDPSWVDVKNKLILIPSSKFKGNRTHTVPLNKNALAIIESEMGKHPDRVFTHMGKPVERVSLKGWHELFDSLGINDELRASGLLSKEKDDDGEYIERFVLHGMRHTFATWLAKADVPLEVIKTLGGWSAGGSDKMVNIYTHTKDVNHLLPYVRKIDAILAGKLKI